MAKILAFLKRDVQEMLSYKIAFMGELLGIIFPLLTFFFVSKLMEGSKIESLAPYGGNYFPFVLVGIAFSSYLMIALYSFTGIISTAQTNGTLEALLCTQTDLPVILLSASLFPFIRGAVNVLLYLAAGVLFFNVHFVNPNIAGLLIISILTVVCFASIGIISASFIMVFKKGDPVMWLFSSASGLLSGVMYPVAIMPGWLQKTAQWIPLTHSLEGIRKSLLMGAPIARLSGEIKVLSLLTAVLLPLSLFLFSQAVRKAKKDGTLTQF
ncbi:MAG TPA: ABC transporter permease [bacterium]|jgi:ABC-2 type transport system permease protein|nr:ABC transporter permease [bacterium]